MAWTLTELLCYMFFSRLIPIDFHEIVTPSLWDCLLLLKSKTPDTGQQSWSSCGFAWPTCKELMGMGREGCHLVPSCACLRPLIEWDLSMLNSDFIAKRFCFQYCWICMCIFPTTVPEIHWCLILKDSIRWLVLNH